MPTRTRQRPRRRPRHDTDVIVCYSGEPFTAEEQDEFLSDAACEARWKAGVPIDEIESKRGRPPKRSAQTP